MNRSILIRSVCSAVLAIGAASVVHAQTYPVLPSVRDASGNVVGQVTYTVNKTSEPCGPGEYYQMATYNVTAFKPTSGGSYPVSAYYYYFIPHGCAPNGWVPEGPYKVSGYGTGSEQLYGDGSTLTIK